MRLWPIALLLLSPPVPAADPATDLIRRLGDDDFDRREAAQNELVRLGDVALPALDAREPFADPEVAYRVAEVRRLIAGPAGELRAALALMTQGADGRNDALPKIARVVAGKQPKAGDFLLGVACDPKHKHRGPAVEAFVSCWDSLTPEQVRAYLERTLRVDIAARPAYPQGVPAMIGVGYHFEHGWGARRLRITTETRHTLDGAAYGPPYRVPYPSVACTTAWVRTGTLPAGKHTLSAAVRFEAVHQGVAITGTVRSPEHAFEVVPDAPDHLAGPSDADAEKRLRASLWIADTAEGREAAEQFPNGVPPDVDWWRPQTAWKDKDGKPTGLHVPVWRLEKPLPFDLAFDVFLRVGGTDHPADTLVAVAGETRNLGHVFVTDAKAVAAGRSGFVPVRVVLRPSRAAALTNPRVTRYFSREIVSEPLRMKVGPPDTPASGD